MSTETFSIVIPTLNEEKHIGRLLTSLANQTQTAHEIIVVDCNSQDQTTSIAKSLGAKVIISDRGVGHQRTVGGKAATGSWLVFIDADTVVPPPFLESIAKYASDPKVGMLTPTYVPEENSFVFRCIYFLLNTSYTFLAVFKPAAAGMCMLIRKYIFNKVGTFKDGIIGEEIDYTARGSAYTKLKQVPVPVIVSVRRFYKDGFWTSTWKYVATFFLFITNQIDQTARIEYTFGHYELKK